MEIDNLYLFLIILPIIAFLYASVGHGGASGYLALMALCSFTPEVMKPTALLLNLFVSGAAFYFYYKEGHFNKKLFLSFARTSIPFAFLGGAIIIDASFYKKILAFFLITAIFKILNLFGKEPITPKKIILWQGLLLGCFIGFFSGLIGVGGGIILTPIILVLHWGSMKEAAAVSALFIWVNSAAGLFGQYSTGIKVPSDVYMVVLIAFIGGLLGSYCGSKKFNNGLLKNILATVLITACIKLVLV